MKHTGIMVLKLLLVLKLVEPFNFLFQISNHVQKKVREWLKRYLAIEIVGTITALLGAGIARALSNNLILVAYCGSLGESIGFYATVLVQHIIIAKKNQRAINKRFSFRILIKMVTNIVLEFGPAGFIDGLLLRPFYMYIFPILLHHFMLGILVGKIIGDISFYAIVIISYELNKRRQISK